MPRREIDPDPVLRTVRAYTGAEFEGQLLNRGRGEQLEGVEVVNARDDSREPQRTVEQPGLRPVSATPPAADAHAQGSALPVPTRQANQAGSPSMPGGQPVAFAFDPSVLQAAAQAATARRPSVTSASAQAATPAPVNVPAPAVAPAPRVAPAKAAAASSKAGKATWKEKLIKAGKEALTFVYAVRRTPSNRIS